MVEPICGHWFRASQCPSAADAIERLGKIDPQMNVSGSFATVEHRVLQSQHTGSLEALFYLRVTFATGRILLPQNPTLEWPKTAPARLLAIGPTAGESIGGTYFIHADPISGTARFRNVPRTIGLGSVAGGCKWL